MPQFSVFQSAQPHNLCRRLADLCRADHPDRDQYAGRQAARPAGRERRDDGSGAPPCGKCWPMGFRPPAGGAQHGRHGGHGGPPVEALKQAKIAGGVDTAYVVFPDKRMIFSEKQDLPPGYDPTGRPWYQQASAATGIALTEPYVDAATKKLVITFAGAVKDRDAVKAVTALDVFMDGVASNVASIRPTPNTQHFRFHRQQGWQGDGA